MPIQTTDQSRAPITINSDGQQVNVPSVKTVDADGRLITANQPQQETQSNISEQSNSETTSQTQPEAKPKNTEAETRKLFLQAQKADRRAKEMEKKAADNLQRAEAFDKAKSLAESGEDPTAVLIAAGLNPAKFFKDLGEWALSDKNIVEDPTQKALREHEERLNKYAKDLEVQATTIKQKEEMAQHNTVIARDVIPLLQNNPERYETLLLEYGQNAATEVYKTLWERYQQLGHTNDDAGVPLTFERVADTLEEYWFNKIETGYNAASKLKKFRNKFIQQDSEQRQQSSNDQEETPSRSFTLSNQHITPSSANNTPYDSYLDNLQRRNDILKKFKDY